MKSLRIVFMGTPDFAVASLDTLLHKSIHDVVSVVTAPDKKAGRGKKLKSSAVKDYAFRNDINYLQPANLKDNDLADKLKSLNPDLFVVVAFRMLPKKIWQIPKYGTINIHASLLPQYRGAAPINHAIINGETKTGVTSFFIDEKIDTGEIIKQKETKIGFNDNAGILHDKLMDLGASLLVETVNEIAQGNIKTIPQPKNIESNKIANKIFKEDCKINWNKPAIEVYNFIRGLSPYPGAYTYFVDENNKKIQIKIFSSEIIKTEEFDSHMIKTDNRNYINIKCKDAYISLKEIQLQGKKINNVSVFLNGYDMSKIATVY